jgi:hypothetical protein
MRSKTSDQTFIEGLKQFNKYGDLFQDLTKRTYIDTIFDVVSMIITYDSKHAIAIVTESDESFQMQGYDLNTNDRVFSVPFTGRYIKMNLVEQTLDGKILAVGY